MPQFAAISGNFTRDVSSRFSLSEMTPGNSQLSKITGEAKLQFSRKLPKIAEKKSQWFRIAVRISLCVAGKIFFCSENESHEVLARLVFREGVGILVTYAHDFAK
jgi:hypothetical protein